MHLKQKRNVFAVKGAAKSAGYRGQPFQEFCRQERAGWVQGMLNSAVWLPHEVFLVERKQI